MIDNLQITGIHTVLTPEIEIYADKKIGGVDKYIPKKARASAKADIKIKESKKRTQKKTFSCEVILGLPHGSITVQERGDTALAAIDLAENKLKVQLKKYKEKHGGPRLHRRFANRFKRAI